MQVMVGLAIPPGQSSERAAWVMMFLTMSVSAFPSAAGKGVPSQFSVLSHYRKLRGDDGCWLQPDLHKDFSD